MDSQTSVYKDLANEGRFLLNRAEPSARALRRFLDRALVANLNFDFSTWSFTQQQQILAKLQTTWIPFDSPGVAVKLYIDTESFCLPFEKYDPRHNVSILRVTVSRWRQVYDDLGNRYTMPLKDWVQAVENFISVCLVLHRTLVQVNEFLTEPTYVYRGLPCSVVPPQALWEVAGHDLRGGSGVLEWATSRSDAEFIVSKMEREPARFKDIACRRYATELDPADEQIVQIAAFCSNDPTFGELEMLRDFGQEQLVSEGKLVLGKSYWVSGPKYALYQFAVENQNVFFSQSPMLGGWHALT